MAEQATESKPQIEADCADLFGMVAGSIVGPNEWNDDVVADQFRTQLKKLVEETVAAYLNRRERDEKAKLIPNEAGEPAGLRDAVKEFIEQPWSRQRSDSFEFAGRGIRVTPSDMKSPDGIVSTEDWIAQRWMLQYGRR